MGVRDYVGKNRFPGVLLGLSGGVDSALTLAIAVDALGARPRARRDAAVAVHARRSASRTRATMAGTLGVRYDEIPIEPMFDAFRDALAAEFRGLPPDATEENIQARIRGTLLMALSNKFGSIVLTTGNKIGDGGRLRHALRRHGRRLRRAEGHQQDAGLPAVRTTATRWAA